MGSALFVSGLLRDAIGWRGAWLVFAGAHWRRSGASLSVSRKFAETDSRNVTRSSTSDSGSLRRLQDALAVGVGVLVQLPNSATHVAQACEAAVVHIRGGQRDVAQPGNAELAEVAVLKLDVAGPGRGGASRVVVVAAQQIERAVWFRIQRAGRRRPGRARRTDAGVRGLAVGGVRSDVAERAIALADEDPEAAPGSFRIRAVALPATRIPAKSSRRSPLISVSRNAASAFPRRRTPLRRHREQGAQTPPDTPSRIASAPRRRHARRSRSSRGSSSGRMLCDPGLSCAPSHPYQR